MSEGMNVRLTAGQNPGAHRLEIEGPDGEWVDISGAVHDVTTHVGVGERARLTLRVGAFHGAHEGNMELFLPRDSVRLLRSFGWAPPEGASEQPDGSIKLTMHGAAWAVAWGMQ